jgi:hypothetical protein
MTERRVRIGMILVGLVIWVVALPLPGYNIELLLLSGAFVAWATFGLLTES